MKNFISLFLIAFTLFASAVIPSDANAQIVRQLTIVAADDTLTNADEALVTLSLDGSFKSVEGQVVKVSGTVAGTIVLQGKTLNGSSWEDITSFTLTDVSTQYKLFAVPSPRVHQAYRIRLATTGTSVVIPKVYTLRYTGS